MPYHNFHDLDSENFVIECNHVATLLAFVLRKINRTTNVVVCQTTKENLDKNTAELCALMQKLSEEEQEKVFDKSEISVELAHWWENHQEFERQRLTKEEYNALLDTL